MTNSDTKFLTAFEECTLPFTRWDHRAHVRVGYLYSLGSDLIEATNRMRTGIQRYNAAQDLPEGPGRGYHETMTRAFMQLIHQAANRGGPYVDSVHFCKKNPELLDRRVLLCYYTRETLMASEAKGRFVEPDITGLEQNGLAYPEFGRPSEGVDVPLLLSVYAVVREESGRLAVVDEAGGKFLPGGMQGEESTAVTLRGAATRQCGFNVQIGRPIGVADQFKLGQDRDGAWCERSSFYRASPVTGMPREDASGRLLWLEPGKAVEILTVESHRWAVSRAGQGCPTSWLDDQWPSRR